MIPDKIYLPVIASPLLHRDVIENHWIETESPFAKENIAYIRKDALLEWLQERIKCGGDEGLMANYMADLAYKDVIDHINSM